MAKKILLIESDVATSSAVARALEARGLETRVTGDGKEGMELARDIRPDAIVLSVELPRLSGYSVCQKLRKDEDLRGIPLVLTSAEATEKTFEDHRKLKARADEYLLKPYAPAALLAKLAALLHLPGGPAGEPAAEGEELVTLQDVEELSGEIPLIPEGETVSARDALPEQDEDLKLLDDAFDSIAGDPSPEPAAEPAARRPAPPAHPGSAAAASEGEGAVASEDLAAAADLLPAEETVAPAEIDRLGEEADKALAALGADEPTRGAPGPFDQGPLADEPLSLSSAIAGRPAAGNAAEPPPALADGGRLAHQLAETLAELARERETAARYGAELQGLRSSGDGLSGRLGQLEAELAARDAQLRQRAEEARHEAEGRAAAEERARAAEQARVRAEAEAQATRQAVQRAQDEVARNSLAGHEGAEERRQLAEKASRLESELAALQLRVEEAEQAGNLHTAQLAQARGQISSMEAELAAAQQVAAQLDALRAELDAVHGAHESARADLERRAGDAQRRVDELEAANAKHEERVVKAYQKIKSDEKIREKTRKALAIALQLLDERIAGAAPKEPGEPVPRRE